ncbi:phosphoglycerate mutase 3 [Monosporozyma unispora]|nr:phosphoglycerate mutase protein gpm3 [Kazachstania unispora]
MTASSETFKIFVLRHGQSELNHENIFCGWIDAHLTQKGKNQASNTADLIKDYCQTNNVKLPETGYTSRLVRTQETMEVILQKLGKKGQFEIVSGLSTDLHSVPYPKTTSNDCDVIPVLQTWRLNERHYGAWQGQRKPNILKKYGDEQYMYIRRDYNGKPPRVDLNLEMIQENDDKGALTGYEFKEPNRHQKYYDEEIKGEHLPDSESLAEVVKRMKPFLENIVLRFGKEQHQESCLLVAHGSSVRSILKVLENISDAAIKDVDIPNGIPLVLELNKSDFKLVKSFYLDPESAKINAAKVRKEGFEKNP